MDRLTIVRTGGQFPFPSRAEVNMTSLAEADRTALLALFKRRKLPPAEGFHGYTYTITRRTEAGEQTIKVPWQLAPKGLDRLVKDELP